MKASEHFIDKVNDRSLQVGIIGMGYVGLPLAREFADAGFRVTGFDIDLEKTELLAAGKSYIHHIPPETVAALLDAGKFRPTSDFSLLAEIDAILICVPTPLKDGREPDLSYVIATTKEIANHLREGQLVVLESTTYPGTTEEEMLPLFEEKGLKCGTDFFLAYSPEREDPGNPNFTARTIPKVVGGVTPACLAAAAALYGAMATEVVTVSSTSAAEASKILENIYRAVNIALVNELKTLFTEMGIDIWEVIRAASTKPFGFHAFYPGPGLGGHCIPIDPFYLAWKARQYGVPTKFIELAGEINTRMPAYVIERLAGALKEKGKSLDGADIMVLGAAYKEDVDDIRESPALELISILQKAGARVCYHDPFIPKIAGLRHYPDMDLDSTPLSAEKLASLDAVVIATKHSNVDYSLVVEHAPLVVDTRNATDGIDAPAGRIVQA